jgi:hypothetical protein
MTPTFGAAVPSALAVMLTSTLLLSTGLRASPPPPPDLNGLHTIVQVHTGRSLDAHLTASTDFAVVTRPSQPNATQRWYFTNVGNGIYTIEQQSSARFLDAHTTVANDFAVVTRPRQNNPSQRWVLVAMGNDRYKVRQQGGARHLDAHDTPDKDFAVVTRPPQLNATQEWIIRPVPAPAQPPPSPGTCSISGTIIGPVEAGAEKLREMALLTRPSSGQAVKRSLNDRNFSFSNVQPGATYDVRPFGGWRFHLINGPVQCEPNRSQRLYIRILGFQFEGEH